MYILQTEGKSLLVYEKKKKKKALKEYDKCIWNFASGGRRIRKKNYNS